jgi:hypothetical protein
MRHHAGDHWADMKIANHGSGRAHYFTCTQPQGSAIKINNNNLAPDFSFGEKSAYFLPSCARSAAFEKIQRQ